MNRVYPNRDAIMRLNGVGLTLTDIVKIVGPRSPCNRGENYSVLGQSSFYETTSDRSSGLLVFNLLSDAAQGKVCYRYCDTDCTANTPFDDTGLVLPLVQPTLTQVSSPSRLQLVSFDSRTLSTFE